MTFRIRRARDSDAAALALLSGQLGYASTPQEVLARLRAVVARTDHAVFVAEADGSVVGWVHAFGTQVIEADACAEIGGLVVEKEQRGRGVGAALVARAEAWGRELGYRHVRVRSNVVRERAHRFYEKHGYECTKQSRVFTKVLVRA